MLAKKGVVLMSTPNRSGQTEYGSASTNSNKLAFKSQRAAFSPAAYGPSAYNISWQHNAHHRNCFSFDMYVHEVAVNNVNLTRKQPLHISTAALTHMTHCLAIVSSLERAWNRNWSLNMHECSFRVSQHSFKTEDT